MAYPRTGFAAYSPTHARYVLAAAVVLAIALVGLTLSPLASGFTNGPTRGPGDIELYRAEVARMQAGEGYYAAANAELRARGYPTGSVFNWRSPLPVALLGSLPSLAWGQTILAGLSGFALLSSFGFIAREAGRGAMAVGLLFLTGALLPCVLGDLCVLPELWAGVLILLSALMFAKEREYSAAAFATAAAMVRELAVPVLVIGLVTALARRRWKAAGTWTAGLLLFAVFYGWHLSQVLPFIQPGDRLHARSWICFGGAPFVISTMQMNIYLLVLPQWVTAIYMVLMLLGFAGWHSRGGQFAGLIAAAFLAAFAVVGQPFNQYWGSLLAPLGCLGAAHGVVALRDLCQAAKGFPRAAALPNGAAH